MTILVTGATGNIGRHVVAGLVAAGKQVRAMTRRPAPMLPGVEVCSATDKDLFEGVDKVYLYPWAPKEFIEAAGARRFVVHSAAAAGFPADLGDTALGRHLAEERDAHRDVELLVEATGAEWTHVRPGLLAVNALAWADQIRTAGVVREPYGQSGYPVVHEADVAEVAVRALLTDDHVGKAYTLTGPAKVTQVEQVKAISTAIDQPVRFEELTPEQAPDEWRTAGWPEEFIGWRLELLADGVEGTGMLPVTDTFCQVTGRPPRDFARWAREHAADFQRNVAA